MEAAFFPGSLFLLSKWYKRSELGQRTALLSCGSLISNAFGSLIASGILDGMDGKLGRAAWRYIVRRYFDLNGARLFNLLHHRWLFYIEGALTISVCLALLIRDKLSLTYLF